MGRFACLDQNLVRASRSWSAASKMSRPGHRVKPVDCSGPRTFTFTCNHHPGEPPGDTRARAGIQPVFNNLMRRLKNAFKRRAAFMGPRRTLSELAKLAVGAASASFWWLPRCQSWWFSVLSEFSNPPAAGLADGPASRSSASVDPAHCLGGAAELNGLFAPLTSCRSNWFDHRAHGSGPESDRCCARS